MGRPANKKRKAEQEQVKRYQKDREDLQLRGRVPTVPEGAVRDERVDPRTQGSQPLPQLVLQALKEDWSTPGAAKPKIVASLLEPFYVEDVVVDKDGNQVRVPPNRGMQIACAKVLKDLDVVQHERDHPEEAGKAKGGINVSAQAAAGFSWGQVTGDEPPDPVEQRLAELEQIKREKESSDEPMPDLR